jgi:hypothetical protein
MNTSHFIKNTPPCFPLTTEHKTVPVLDRLLKAPT